MDLAEATKKAVDIRDFSAAHLLVATPPSSSTALPTPSPSVEDLAEPSSSPRPTARALVASTREIIAVARGQKKHPTVDGYAKILANLDLRLQPFPLEPYLDLLDAILDVGDHVATALTSFKADLIAELLATTSRSSTGSYASAARAAPPPPSPPATPKAPPAAKPNEFIISLDKAANELLKLPVPEIKTKVEAAAAATGAEKLKDIMLKGVTKME
ncbi:hypothetical protein B0H13DRAFT_2302638 [Mycena leptocephala]|nr:hypothetical protein B0H13DRAFT_2302638 [Mycena leptocephala]